MGLLIPNRHPWFVDLDRDLLEKLVLHILDVFVVRFFGAEMFLDTTPFQAF